MFRRCNRCFGLSRRRGLLLLAHRADETDALAGEGSDKALFLPGVVDRASGSVDAGAQR
jgi:hypothetical protein